MRCVALGCRQRCCHRLTTATFDILKNDPSVGRAEALRRAMLAYMNDSADPLNAYPPRGPRWHQTGFFPGRVFA
jgi:hypothetical protein